MVSAREIFQAAKTALRRKVNIPFISDIHNTFLRYIIYKNLHGMVSAREIFQAVKTALCRKINIPFISDICPIYSILKVALPWQRDRVVQVQVLISLGPLGFEFLVPVDMIQVEHIGCRFAPPFSVRHRTQDIGCRVWRRT